MRRLWAVLILVLAAAGCGDSTVAVDGIRIMVPNEAGSGYDVTARVAAQALRDARIQPDVEVFNLPGAGGTVGLRRLAYETGNPRLLMLMGQGLIGAQHTYTTDTRLEDTTPIARLVEDPEIIVVDKDSPFRTMDELVAAWRADPGGLAVGGGSTPGGPDHLAVMLSARAIGLDPLDVDYREYDGGGDLLASVLDSEVAFAAAGASEYPDQIASGQLRVLAVTGDTAPSGVVAPTMTDLGFDVVFTNWRGIVAPPGLSAAEEAELRDTIARLHDSAEWADIMKRFDWADAYLSGDEFGEFIAESAAETADVLADLGLDAN